MDPIAKRLTMTPFMKSPLASNWTTSSGLYCSSLFLFGLALVLHRAAVRGTFWIEGGFIVVYC